MCATKRENIISSTNDYRRFRKQYYHYYVYYYSTVVVILLFPFDIPRRAHNNSINTNNNTRVDVGGTPGRL